MLRQGLRSFARVATTARPFTTSGALRAEEATSKHTSSAFVEAWAKAAPSNLDLPAFPADGIPPSADVPTGTIPDKLTFNFYMPHSREITNEKVRCFPLISGLPH